MKITEYFKYTRSRPDKIGIKDEWIQQAIENPVEEQIQTDGRIRRWVWIPSENEFLRVVLLEDGKTVHNAFLDRSFKSGAASDEDQVF